MKKKLIEAIKAKFVGIDDGTATRLAERTIRKGEPITSDDEVTAAVDAITLSDVLKSVSDFSADDATRKYESRFNLKDGKPISSPDPEPKAGAPAPGKAEPKEGEPTEDKAAENKVIAMFQGMLKGLTERIDTLGSDISALRQEKVDTQRRTRLEEAIKDLREIQKKAYMRIPLKDLSNEDFETLLTEVKEEVGDIVAENKATGAVVSTPLGVSHAPSAPAKEATSEELNALAEKFNL